MQKAFKRARSRRRNSLLAAFGLLLAILLTGAWLGATSLTGDTQPLYAQQVNPYAVPEAIPPEAIPNESAQVTVSPYLNAQLATGGGADVPILIVLKDQLDLSQLQAQAAGATPANSPQQATLERRTYLYQTLTANALQSQASLRAWLDGQGIPYRAHYIINMIRVTGGAALVESLRQRPEVARLDADPEVDEMHQEGIAAAQSLPPRWARLLSLLSVPADPSQTGEVATPAEASSPDTTYGVAVTHAPEVWAMGFTGQGITVASQDTGVQWDHPALRPRYRGVNGNMVDHTYNWLDAIIPDNGSPDKCAGSVAPCDDYGHGTHTVGTMVGETTSYTYGVAPGAEWMGCRNMRKGVGSPESYTTCFEFFMAPYPPGGDPFQDGRPELAPDIINNSWGCPDTEGCNKDSLRQVVETIRAAGLMVVASTGNIGLNGCSTVQDPIAIYDATFSVGAHDANGNLAVFSSRGPVTVDGSRRLKPDLTAPGVNVLSTYPTSRTTTLSGTSMAAPHVAGAVALIWSAAPWLRGNPGLTEQLLVKSATPVYSNECTDGAAEVSPNPAFGYGRLDIEAATESALRPWGVSVTAKDPSGAAVSGAQVRWIDARTGYTYSATTDVKGSALLSPTLAGLYTLEVQTKAGTLTIDNVEVVNDKINEKINEEASYESAADAARVEWQSLHFDILYDKAVVGFPQRQYMPGIFQNE